MSIFIKLSLGVCRYKRGYCGKTVDNFLLSSQYVAKRITDAEQHAAFFKRFYYKINELLRLTRQSSIL